MEFWCAKGRRVSDEERQPDRSFAPQRTRWDTYQRIASLLLVLLLSIQRVETNSDANRLYEDLMMSYNRFVRPVQNDSDTLVVKLGLKLSQLIDVVSKLAVIVLGCLIPSNLRQYVPKIRISDIK